MLYAQRIAIYLSDNIIWNHIVTIAVVVAVLQIKMTHDDKYMVTVSDDYCIILWRVIDRDGRGKKVDREHAYSQEILIPKFDLQEKVLIDQSVYYLRFKVTQ